MHHDQVVADVQRLIDEYVGTHANVKVLEAGCGSSSCFDFRHTHVTGIDLLEKQLARNTVIQDAILGDIQGYPFAKGAFDIIISWDVLEHVPDAKRALENLAQALAADGFMIVKTPNLFSLKGLVTKFTPLSFHVWFYRRVTGMQDFGTEDKGPFRTYFNACISPKGLQRFARDSGLRLAYFTPFEKYWTGNAKIRAINALIRTVSLPVRLLTLGKIRLTDSELIAVFQRRTGSPTAAR